MKRLLQILIASIFVFSGCGDSLPEDEQDPDIIEIADTESSDPSNTTDVQETDDSDEESEQDTTQTDTSTEDTGNTENTTDTDNNEDGQENREPELVYNPDLISNTGFLLGRPTRFHPGPQGTVITNINFKKGQISTRFQFRERDNPKDLPNKTLNELWNKYMEVEHDNRTFNLEQLVRHTNCVEQDQINNYPDDKEKWWRVGIRKNGYNLRNFLDISECLKPEADSDEAQKVKQFKKDMLDLRAEYFNDVRGRL